jgi:flagellum-specific peptidoglycan hydrolase FlgJ
MKPSEFVKTYWKDAVESEKSTGISRFATLAQAAWESAWGKAAPGNMFFGVKDTDGINGNEQLLITHEYSRRPDAKFPVILSVTPVVKNGVKMFKYKIKDYFRKYATPAECFTDHGKFYQRNPRYAAALQVKQDPYLFVEKVAKAGYATDPNYSANLKKMIDIIKAEAKKQGLA